MNIEWLYVPTLLRGAGYIILYISLTVYVTGIVPFQHFFQVLSILGFIRTGFGSVLGGAIYSRVWAVHPPGELPDPLHRTGRGEHGPQCTDFP